MITELLELPEFENRPPVLIDIGASQDLPSLWKEIAPYCICIAFDGDKRDFDYIKEKEKQYKKLIIVDKVVTVLGGEIDFYLTKSPYCSSTLKTDVENLSNYAFADLFEIEKTVKLTSVPLSSVLLENEITYIDWFKTDTQGTDLRIVKSLDNGIVNNVLLFELEPGIIDAYLGEDKLYDVLEYFNKNKFIVIDANIKGSQRINISLIKNKLPVEIVNNIHRFLPQTPDWCEVSFFNPFITTSLTIREYLLGWIFASIKKQHGLALEIANKGLIKFGDAIFIRIMENTIQSMETIAKNKIIRRTFKSRVIHFLKRL